jgi:SAM-dependent methyltransferase
MNDLPPVPVSSQEWWRNFFRGNWHEVLLQGMKPPDVTAEEADYVRTMLDLEPGQKVLDVPSGDGRLGIPLAEAGCLVTGVDLEPDMVAASNEVARRLGVGFTAREGDMRDLPWFDEFDAAFCFFASFGYADENADRMFLESVWRALKPSAPFLLDVLTVETVLPGFVSKDWFEAGRWTVLEERRFDHATSRVEGVWTFYGDGVVERKETSVRLYSYRELELLLNSCGFGGFSAYDTLTDTPFSMDASRLTLIARKRA